MSNCEWQMGKDGREGEAFYLSRKTLTTKMGGADCEREMQKVVSGGRRASGANETAF